MKKCIVFLLLGGLLVSCKAESTTIAYTAISSVIIIGGFIGYVIAASTRIFITEADEILFRDLFKKENEGTEEPPASSQASWETKKPPWVSLKEAFFKKVQAEEINLHSQKSINWSEIQGEEIFLVPQPHQET